MNRVKQSMIGLLISISSLYSAIITVPGDYGTIQEAINASVDGDSISVSSGTYYENINFFGKNIKVVGEDQNTTVIDGAMDDIDPVGIINGGFEFYDSADNEWQLIPRNWNTWESGSASSTECCYHIALNGENIFNSDAIFTTYEGAAALKMWGSGSEWNVYQEFYNYSPGTQIDVSAMVFQATDDHIGDGSSFYVFVKYFDNQLNLLSYDYSQEITYSDSMDVWLTRSVSSVVPSSNDGNNPTVQIGMVYIGSGGAVVTDNVQLSINGESRSFAKNNQNIIEYDPSIYPDRTRQGGDTVEDAIVFSSIPYSNFGNTQGYNDDYDIICDAGSSTSPDVVYAYTPNEDELFNVSTCGNGSFYDTKIYVYENTIGNLANTLAGEEACSDDLCSNNHQNWLSLVQNIDATAGNTYYVVIDGWGGESGEYQLNINYPMELGQVVVFERQENNDALLMIQKSDFGLCFLHPIENNKNSIVTKFFRLIS